MRKSSTELKKTWRLLCPAQGCRNGMGYWRDGVEATVLKGIRLVLEEADLEQAYMEAYDANKAALASELATQRQLLEKRVAELDRLCNKLIDATLLRDSPDDMLRERRARATAERDAAKYELSSLPSVPPSPDLRRRKTLLEAFDDVVRLHAPGADRSGRLEDLHLQACAAIRGLIESLKIRRIMGSRGFEVTLVVRVDSMFQTPGAREATGARRTFELVCHRKLGLDARIRKADDELVVAWHLGRYDATDEQYKALLPLLGKHALVRLDRARIAPRTLVDVLFFLTRTNAIAYATRLLFPETTTSLQLNTLIRILEADGTWQKIADTVATRFPELFALMDWRTKSGSLQLPKSWITERQ
jgi:hypothetical protein